MPLYEITFIARPDISPNDVDKLTENFSSFINESNGKVEKTEYWGLRNLAYKVKKNRKGHYVMLAVDAPYDIVSEVERRMKLNEDIIKNITIKVEAFDEGPSIMMNNKSYEESENDNQPSEEVKEVEEFGGEK
ncbi:MAG: 30S ribosomal protein S6 [Alphaproteobacteria bacterium]